MAGKWQEITKVEPSLEIIFLIIWACKNQLKNFKTLKILIDFESHYV